jgi:AraC family transcriptional regulator
MMDFVTSMQADSDRYKQSASYEFKHSYRKINHRIPTKTPARAAGAFGGVLVDAIQPAGIIKDPATDDVVLIMVKPQRRAISYSYDFGLGKVKTVVSSNNLHVQPVQTACELITNEPMQLLTLSVPSAQVRSIQENSGIAAIDDFGALHTAYFSDPFLEHSLLRLFEWSAVLQDTHKLAREGLLLAMVVRLTELSRLSGMPALKSHQALARWQIRRVIERVTSDLSVSPSLEELAALVDMSQFHFCRAFKKALGQSPIQYLIAQRIEKATQLLSQTSLPIADVGAQVGYADAAYFSRLYRNKTGLLPSSMRRRAA